MESIQKIFEFFSSPLFKLIVRMLTIYLVIFWLSTVIWVYRDAKRRGSVALTWSALAIAFPVLGVFIYLLLRPSESVEEAELRALEYEFKRSIVEEEASYCPACGKKVESDFQICPYCLKKLKKSCRNCGKLLKLEWQVCPYCKVEQ